MKGFTKEKRIPKHPSFGYAYPEQIKRLNTLGFGPDRDALLKRIEIQQERKGKPPFD
jgi:hypothetical protein